MDLNMECMQMLRMLPNDAQVKVHQTMAQRAVDCCHAHLQDLYVWGHDENSWSVQFTKAKMRVYYSVIQGDAAKCRAAIKNVKPLAYKILDEVMEGASVGIVRGQDKTYVGEDGHTDENARQLGHTLKITLDRMEEMCAAIEQQ